MFFVPNGAAVMQKSILSSRPGSWECKLRNPKERGTNKNKATETNQNGGCLNGKRFRSTCHRGPEKGPAEHAAGHPPHAASAD